jgi:preprotein translocase subunit YajC
VNEALMVLLATPREGANGAVVLFVQMGLFFVIIYWLFIRPQRKEQQRFREMVAAVKTGDEIVTSGGVVGKVVHATEKQLTIKSDQSRMIIERSGIARVITQDSESE